MRWDRFLLCSLFLPFRLLPTIPFHKTPRFEAHLSFLPSLQAWDYFSLLLGDFSNWLWWDSGHITPQIWCLVSVNILSWRNLRNGRFRKDFLSISLKQDLRLSCETCSSSTGRNRASLISKDGRTCGGNLNHRTYSVPLCSLHLLRHMVLSHFPMISILHQNHKNVQFSLFSSSHSSWVRLFVTP